MRDAVLGIPYSSRSRCWQIARSYSPASVQPILIQLIELTTLLAGAYFQLFPLVASNYVT